jgi:hypothetical protein
LRHRPGNRLADQEESAGCHRPEIAQTPRRLANLRHVTDAYGFYGYSGNGLGSTSTIGLGGNTMTNIIDGASNTIMIGEDSSYHNHMRTNLWN